MKILKGVLLAGILYSGVSAAQKDYCIELFPENLQEQNLSLYKNSINPRVLAKDSRKNILDLSHKIIFAEPYNANIVNDFISKISTQDYSNEFLETLEVATVFSINKDSLKKIKRYYLNNFDSIRRLYKERPTAIRFAVLKKLGIFTKEELSQIKKRFQSNTSYKFQDFENIKNKDLITPKRNIPYKECYSRFGFSELKSKTSALDLAGVYIQAKLNPGMEPLFFAAANNSNLWYYYEYLYTGEIEHLAHIAVDKTILVTAASDIFDKDIFKSWWLTNEFLSNKKPTVIDLSEFKSIEEAKSVNLAFGEEISSLFYRNKDFKTHEFVKFKTIDNFRRIFKIENED